MGAAKKAVKSIFGTSNPAAVTLAKKASPAKKVVKETRKRNATEVADATATPSGRFTRSRSRGRTSLINDERRKTLG